MMNSRQFSQAVLLLGWLSLTLGGCIWDVRANKKDISYSPSQGDVDTSSIAKVAVLPFAQYSHPQAYQSEEEVMINRIAREDVAEHFAQKGVKVVSHEDVDGFLIDRGVLVVLQKDKDPSTLEYELSRQHHSRVMQKNMVRVIEHDRIWGAGGGTAGSPGIFNDKSGFTEALTPRMLKQVGEAFGVDAVVRGRIIDYRVIRHKGWWTSPGGTVYTDLRGIMKVLGFANRDSYERGLPPPTFMDTDLFGDRMEIDVQWNPTTPEAHRVTIVLYLQDVSSGDVVWRQSAEVDYEPGNGSFFPQGNNRLMLDDAVRDAVQHLMADLYDDGVIASVAKQSRSSQ